MATSAVTASQVCQDSLQRRNREKRPIHHHHHSLPHTRPTQRHGDNRQRKLREKRRPANFISTDGTTSGDDFELLQTDESETPPKMEQMIRKNDQLLPSDLDADCEDNNSTDVDTVSVSGSVKIKNEADRPNVNKTDLAILNAKVMALEKQLATVLQINGKLKEENEELKKKVHDN